MPWIRILYRLPLALGLLLVGLVLAALRLRRPPGTSPDAGQRALVSRWLGWAARVLGVRIRTGGRPAPGPVLLVANHVSWLDIVVLGSTLPVVFVAKAEIRDWPLVGWLAALAGTLFIRRGGKHAAETVAQAMTEALRAGVSVAVFPEGTTTDGRQVRRFHPRLLAAAQSAGVPVQPAAITYPHERGVHPAVPFIGRDTFLRSALRVLTAGGIVAEVRFCPALAPREDRRSLAQEAHDCIEAIVLRGHTAQRGEPA
jgi:1-acyl-sn-glycerol-3-phosphate acyltransferase